MCEVNGEPCAWCNGAVCHSNGTNRCEVYSIQMHGAGKALADMDHDLFRAPGLSPCPYGRCDPLRKARSTCAPGISVAQCEDGVVKRHLPVSQVAAPPFPIPRPTEIGCLKVEPQGCSNITSQLQCLSSVDGSQASYAGLRLKGEACVWCGGGHCHTGGSARCAPFDYLARGAGRAFGSLNAVALTAAQCSQATPEFGDLGCLKETAEGCRSVAKSPRGGLKAPRQQPHGAAELRLQPGRPALHPGGGLPGEGLAVRLVRWPVPKWRRQQMRALRLCHELGPHLSPRGGLEPHPNPTFGPGNGPFSA